MAETNSAIRARAEWANRAAVLCGYRDMDVACEYLAHLSPRLTCKHVCNKINVVQNTFRAHLRAIGWKWNDCCAPTVLDDIKCPDCEIIFTPKSPAKKRCDKCQTAFIQNRSRLRYLRKKGVTPNIGKNQKSTNESPWKEAWHPGCQVNHNRNFMPATN